MEDRKLPMKKRTARRVLTQQDISYIQRMEKLANERLRFRGKQELLEQQEKETSMLVTTLIELKHSTGEDDRKKKKTPPKIIRTPLTTTNCTTNPLKEELVLEQQTKETNKSATSISKLKRKRSTSTGKDNHKKKKIAPKNVRTPLVINEVTARLKEFIVNELQGTDIKVVIQKTVYQSDTRKGLNRLNMPLNQLEKGEFLTANEMQILNKRIPKENEIEVLLLGPTLKMFRYPMKLKMWHMKSTANYVLTTNWHRFWSENKVQLREEAKIQVWSFRRDQQQLCFAIVCVGEPDVKDDSLED